jgi:hypothetical protein
MKYDHVCWKCFNEEGIQDFIKINGRLKKCDVCNRRNVSHEYWEVVDHITGCIEKVFEDPANSMGYMSSEGGYLGTTYDSYEMLGETGFDTDSSDLMDDIVSQFETDLWCYQNPYHLQRHDELMGAWDQFVNLVKYKSRYMFLHHGLREQEMTLQKTLISNILEDMSEAFEKYGLIKTIPSGLEISRARPMISKNEFPLELKEICCPPPDQAKSSRMSSAGIPIFYGANSTVTALKEIDSNNSYATVSNFKLLKPIEIIDLTKIPKVPSFYAVNDEPLDRSELIFLNKLTKDLARPVIRDGKEHIDYVPTQIIAEYCRFKIKSNGSPIRGFKYSSIKNANGICYALFFDGNNCGNFKKKNYFLYHDKQFLEMTPSSLKVISNRHKKKL